MQALVGRKAEIELLAASLEATAEGQPRFVFVVGEAGVGKTRLLQKAAHMAPGLGLRVLEGTAIQSGRALPYLPLLASLATCIDRDSDGPAEVVRRLVAGEPSRYASDSAGAARVVESIYAILVREPTLLVVDDVQWADAATVTVLDYVSHRSRAEALAVVVAARDDDVELLRRLPFRDGRRFTTLAVPRLSRDEVAQQLEFLLGRPAEPDVLSAVFERSAGNPFFVEQLLANGGSGTPASLRALVLARLAALSPRDKVVVEALAILGRPADEALIAAVAHVTETKAREAAGEAASRGIAVTAHEGVAFRHPLFREVVLADLSGPMRRRLHRVAAAALAETDATAAEIATHWWESDDRERAWSAALDAAEHAEATFAFAEAQLHLERALEVWPTGVDKLPECLLRTARAAWLAGDPETAVDLVRRARAAGAADDAEFQLALGRYAAEARNFAVANAAFERAATLVRADDAKATRGFALAGLARARNNQGRYAEARDAAEAAVKVARDAGDPRAELAARSARGMTHVFVGSLAGIPDLERCVALAARDRSPVSTGRAHEFLSLLLHLAGNLERALEIALAGVEACEALGVARTHGSDLRGRAALIQLELGRWEEADEILASAEERALPALTSVLLAMRRGNLENARLRIEAEAERPASGNAPGEMLSLATAELAWLGGDTATARASLEAIPEFPGIWGTCAAAAAARLAARFAADDRRCELLPALQVKHPDPRLDAALQSEITAERARAAGTPEPRLWAASTREWNKVRRPYDSAYARLREAEALFAVGAREPAKEALRDAAASASALGARPMRALVDDLARRARVSPELPHRRRPDRDEPTPRELDVLALLAEGFTNREIAARLFLSPKTVGIHVSRLHRKLDAHTRGEAVAAARRRGILV
jgi:DNA-binding CsgD family transcriptional regulator/tetratricopeptide (TPR) repeat protein